MKAYIYSCVNAPLVGFYFSDVRGVLLTVLDYVEGFYLFIRDAPVSVCGSKIKKTASDNGASGEK